MAHLQALEHSYQYQDLDPGHIRVVTITGITPDSINCVIDHQEISARGYQSLSYVWGSEDILSCAAIHDNADGRLCLGQIPLTHNLSIAMRDLWESDEITSKKFWIDQICINQQGIEKNHQVAIMDQIYKNAERVILYTGPATGDAAQDARGVQLLSQLNRHFAPNFEMFSRLDDLNEGYQQTHDLPVRAISDEMERTTIEKDWLWLFELCFGTWTTRLWMVQEQLLNPETAVLAGQQLLIWEEILIVPALIGLGLLPIDHLFLDWFARTRSAAVPSWTIMNATFGMWQSARASCPEPQLFVHNMVRYWSLQCADTRDRVYALLTVSSDAHQLSIDVDYAEQPASLFRRTTQAVSAYIMLDSLLGNATYRDNLADAEGSSWALCKPRSAHLLADPLRFKYFTAHPQHAEFRKPVFGNSSRVLLCRGHIIDRVRSTSGPVPMKSSFGRSIIDHSLVCYCASVLEMYAALFAELGWNIESAKALARAMYPHTTMTAKHHTSRACYLFWGFLNWMEDMFNEADTLRQNEANDDIGLTLRQSKPKLAAMQKLFEDNDTLELESDVDRDEESKFDAGIRTSPFGGRTFCITEGGRICTVANQAKEGDVIVTLHGSRVPWALRQTDRCPELGNRIRYLLIGNAWIEGLMSGEAYHGLDPAEGDHEIAIV